MARSKSNKNQNQNNSYGGRETNSFSRRSLPLRVNLKTIEDRRLFNPEPSRAPQTFGRRDLALRLAGFRLVSLKRAEGKRLNTKLGLYEPLPYRLEFSRPEDVIMCARRKIRSEVMHAIGLAGLKRIFRKSGAGSHSQWSKVSC